MSSELLKTREIDGAKVVGVNVDELPFGKKLLVRALPESSGSGDERHTIEELYALERRGDGLYISSYGVSTYPLGWQKCYNIWGSFIGLGMCMKFSIDDALVGPGQPHIIETSRVAEIGEVSANMAAKEALLKYGGHLDTCWQALRDDRPFCTCGWNEVLQTLKG